MIAETQEAFASVANHVWIRETEDNGQPLFVLIDSEGGMECLSHRRSDLFFYVAERELHFVQLN